MGSVGEHRDGWRILRPSSQAGRDGSGLRLASYRKQQPGPADDLRRIPRETSAHSRDPNPRKKRLELLAWCGQVDDGLRLQQRRARRVEPGLARATAAVARLVAR